MKKIVIVAFILVIISLVFLLNQMEIFLLNKTITSENVYYIAKEVDKSNLSEEKKDNIILNIIIQNKNCYGKKVKDLMNR